MGVFMELSKEKMLSMLQTMLIVRAFESPLEDLTFGGKVPGTVHLSIGQEGAAIGTVTALEKTDSIFTFHRSHGNLIAKGLDPKLMMAELWGKATGYCKGKGGSMHITSPEYGVMGSNGIVGIVTVLANGPALYAKLKGTKDVSVAYFGDGASNQGSVHEGMNLASIWKLPTIFVLENNHYAECTNAEYACSVKDFTKRAVAHDMPSFAADGSDVLDVYDNMCQAVKRARNGEGPSLLVLELYRYKGHHVGDPDSYRTKEEVDYHMQNKDCIQRFKKVLIDKRYLSEEEFKRMKEEAYKTIEDAIKFAEESPWPDKSETYTDVYV
jgi:acetoin:2,6-dichlorophenolindophenol oxidoreductase subunit alpha